ncbi:hypothetical protein VIGAN_02311600 [Vigna angularis var. angularis]|nr:hypothetical protein VIGAN_02311600 [Vigna angularis var. angularis]
MWKDALKKSADLSGIESSKFRNDAEVVKEIVDLVVKRLDKPQVNPKGLVGIDEKIATLESWISDEPKATQLVGIWGMGGIGKTTLAEVVFHRLRSQYQESYFLANERDQSKKHGLIHLKKIMFSKLLGHEVDIDTPNYLPENIVRRIGCMKVLVVLDDVNDSDHIEKLVGTLENFGKGSTVIVTTRDEQVLRINRVRKTYKVKEFSSDEALELFKLNAFSGSDEEMEYDEISKSVVHYAKGNPLVVKVLGHLLHGRNKEEWESLLANLKTMPPREVYDVMKLSYDSLDRKGQQIFLDLACFFLRMLVPVQVSDLKCLLKDNESDNLVAFELRRLEDKALITISEDNTVSMHDSLQEMAWEIVRQESVEDPGGRSRLWDLNDINQALENEKVSEAIRSIHLTSDTAITSTKKQMLSPQIFAMRKLKFLDISGVDENAYHQVILGEGANFLATELRFLNWERFPMKSLPESFNAEKLVILDLMIGRMTKLWDGVKNLANLKRLILYCAIKLKELPDLSGAIRLEELYLSGCDSLTSLHSSIFSLPKLEILDLHHCISIAILPSKFEKRVSSLWRNSELRCLNMSSCEQLETIADLPPFLKTLNVSFCLSLKTLPKLPLSLQILNVSFCESLESLPELPPLLSTLNVTSCYSLQIPTNLPLSLQIVNLCDCSLFQTLVERIRSVETKDTKNSRLVHQTLSKLPLPSEISCSCNSIKTGAVSLSSFTSLIEDCLSSLKFKTEE